MSRGSRAAGAATSHGSPWHRPDIDLALLAVPVHLTGDGSTPAGTGALVVGVDSEGFDTATAQLRWLLVAGLGLVVVAVGLLAWVLTGRALRTVTRLTEGPRS